MRNNGTFELTLTQQDIYFDQLRHKTSPLYNVGGYIRLSGVNRSALARAHHKLVQSEEIFGLRITQDTASVGQYISSKRTTELLIKDFSQQADPEIKARQWLESLFTTAIDFTEGELFKSALIVIDQTHCWYLGFAHHLAMDGWGFANWAKRLSEIYNQDSLDNHESIAWQEISLKDLDYLSGKKYQSDKAYWAGQTQLHSEPLLNPHYQHQLDANAKASSARELLHIDSKRVEAIKGIAGELNVGVSSVYMALFAAYFANVYERQSVVFGTTAHNRSGYMQKQMLGVFTSISPMAIKVAHDMPFNDLVKNIAAQSKQAFRHQRFPIGHIGNVLNINTQQNRLFDVCFNYLKLDSQLSFEQQPADLIYLSHNNETNPLMLTVWEYGEQQRTEIQIDYHFGYFTQAEITGLKLRFDNLLNQVLSNSLIAVDQLSYLPSIEIERLTENTITDLSMVETALIHELFIAQALKTPNQIAVCFDNLSLTYKELHLRSDKMAAYLEHLEAHRSGVIGVGMNRNEQLVVVLLAVLKLGCAYVPLDPNYPTSRLEYMINDSGITHVLSNSALQSKFDLSRIHLIAMDKLTDTLAKFNSDGWQRPKVDAQALAYVIYTSGSTGKPKGVEICHQNTVSLLRWANDTFDAEQLRRVLACTSLSFDLSVFEIFVPLSFGYQCVLVQSILDLHQQDIDVSLINTVPCAIRSLYERDAIPAGVKVINLAGEALSKELVNELLTQTSIDVLYNLYGPSEDTTYSTYKAFDAPISDSVSIGKVVDRTAFYVVDGNERLSPTGVAGELYLTGSGVAQGYRNRPQLTENQFIDDPFVLNNPKKVYKTGDLVRLLDNGELAYLGRKDDQVKIRGFRIELAEIESCLRQFSNVADACVVAGEGPSQQKLIHAFVVPVDSEQELNINDLHQGLAAQLPEYMVPNHIQSLKQLPLTPNGKVDRKALAYTAVQSQAQYRPPNGANQLLLAEIFARLLKLTTAKVGADDNFFAMGGNSLLAVGLSAEIAERTGIDIDIADVFEQPTVAGLSKVLEGGVRALVKEPIKAMPRQAFTPLSYAQQRLWFIEQFQGPSGDYNMPFGMMVEGDFQLQWAQKALKGIVSRHEVLHTVYRSKDQQAVAQIIDFDDFKLDIVDLQGVSLAEQSRQVKQHSQEEAQKPFDLSADLMLRGRWLQLSASKGMLLLNMHHIASDGWSVGILIREFEAFYRAYEQHQKAQLPPLSIQYGDYTLWQHENLSEEQLKPQLDYWLNQLADAPIVHSVVLDFNRPQALSHKGQSVVGTLEPATVKQIQLLAKNHGMTTFMVIHAAFSLLLSRYSNTADVVIGTPVANRRQKALEPLIGQFVNTLVLRTNHDGIDTLVDFLHQVKQVNLEAQSNQDIPFELLVEKLKVPRTTNHSPLFQVMLSMDVETPDMPNFNGLVLTPMSALETRSKFDLELNIEPVGDAIELKWTADSALFKHETVLLFNQHLLTLIKSIVTSPEQRLSELALLDDIESEALKHTKQEVVKPLEQSCSVVGLIQQFAQTHGDNLALLSDTQAVSYRQMMDRSSQLAVWLNQQGLAKGQHAGIAMERGIDSIIAILAVLQCGAAYVPLDPNYPQSRLDYMIDDANVLMVLTQQTLADSFDYANVQQVVVEELTAQLQQLNGQSLADVDVKSDDIAYLMYTSGSTGQPKGVKVSHLNWLSFCQSARKAYGFEQKQRVIQFSSMSFDIFIEELSLTLLSGGTLVLPQPQAVMLSQTFWQFIGNNEITAATLPTAYWHTLCQDPQLQKHASGTSLQTLIVGGEALSLTLSKQWFAALGDKIKLFNTYGPTETSVVASVFELKAGSEHHYSVPIGKPLDNTYVLVLDEHHRPVPPGVVGELHIGGYGVSQGYHNQPELTKERFITNPWSKDPQDVLYCSGDLVRWLYDERALEFVGRSDEQVKIRGFRVELAEIELEFNRLDIVSSVLVQVLGSVEKKLVAYVIFNATFEINDEAKLQAKLRSTLLKRLPHYMMPQLVIAVEQWPLTPNGKIDKKALALLEGNTALLRTTFVKPEGKTQQLLLPLWADALSMPAPKVSATASFFDLGGHSLLVVQLAAKIAQQFEVECAIADIFNNDTLADLANHIDELSLTNRVEQQLQDDDIVEEGWL